MPGRGRPPELFSPPLWLPPLWDAARGWRRHRPRAGERTDGRDGSPERNGPFKLEDGLPKLGLAARLCVEGGAPFLYELRQGKPQWEPDEFDSEMSYPMTATAPGTYPYLRR